MKQQEPPKETPTLAQRLAELKAERQQQEPEQPPAIAGLPDKTTDTTPGGIDGLTSTEEPPAIAGLPK